LKSGKTLDRSFVRNKLYLLNCLQSFDIRVLSDTVYRHIPSALEDISGRISTLTANGTSTMGCKHQKYQRFQVVEAMVSWNTLCTR